MPYILGNRTRHWEMCSELAVIVSHSPWLARSCYDQMYEAILEGLGL
jgi:2-oxo-4-hydroxy-4-carboxy--5-ureidoimidazoline (OHCU) decarboxylase